MRSAGLHAGWLTFLGIACLTFSSGAPAHGEAAGTHAALGARAQSTQTLRPFNSIWIAAGGVLPDSACPAWVKGVSDSTPMITGGQLRIHTEAFAQNAYYLQRDSVLMIPDTLVVEARLRFVSGSDYIGPCGHYRQAAVVSITIAGSTGLLFFVGDNEIFLTNGQCSGIVSLVVPTKDAAHTYRIEVANGSTVRVYRDGALALTGTTYASVSDHGSGTRILWGEGSSFAYGTTYWEWVKHNAHKSGCITTDVPSGDREFSVGSLSLRAWPSPARTGTRITWSLSRDARTRVEILDLAGRLLRRLQDGPLASGTHATDWDGREAHGRMVPPGVYLCRVQAGGESAMQRLVRVP